MMTSYLNWEGEIHVPFFIQPHFYERNLAVFTGLLNKDPLKEREREREREKG